MRTFTDAELDALIGCAKRVLNPPRRQMLTVGLHERNDMTLESEDAQHRFQVFMRRSVPFPEDFSIGLDYLPGEEPGSFCLLRCNGQHGGSKAHPHHAYFHIHRSLAEDINTGMKAERQIQQTHEYASFRKALAYFLGRINFAEVDKHFPGLNQGELFPGDNAPSP